MSAAPYTPQRGEVVWLDFDPRSGHEQAGRRLAFVLSPGNYNGKVGLALLCPITSRAKGYPFEVTLPTGLPVSGVILADQVKCLDWRSRQATFLCALPPDVVQAVQQRVRLLVE